MRECKNCGNMLGDDELFCSRCKALVAANNVKMCPKCQKTYGSDDAFCDTCGSQLVYAKRQQNKIETTNVAASNAASTAMRCPECNSPYSNNDEFCGECGYQLKRNKVETVNNTYASAREMYGEDRNVAVNVKSYTNAQESVNSQADKYAKSLFVDNDETSIATLGSGYLQNIVTRGGLSSIKAVLTQKRVYLSGKCFERTGKMWSKRKISRIIEVDDITGTGFEYVANITFIVIAILIILASVVATIIGIADSGEEGLLFMLFAALSIPFFIIYTIKRKTIFQIEYAGGKIGFDVKWLSANDSVYFQRQIHLVKERRKNEKKY